MAKILVVDDEPANRLLLATILEYAGHTILEAAEGGEGLRLAREAQPDLIIVDMYMPGMNGTAFMESLRADPSIGGTKVALYTGTSMNVLIEGFMEMAKIRHVIPKPSEPLDVLRIVGAALEERD